MSYDFSKKHRMLVFGVLLCSVLVSLGSILADTAHINIVQIQDSINPGVEDFLKYAIDRSQEEGAECLIVLLDTPGGLMASMRGIAQSILNSAVPVVVYVSPSGAQAASAGVFVTDAADIAAMAPGTNIGAAHPVSIGGGEVQSTMNEKVVNDMVAFARSIASQRGRNAEWLEDAIRKSVSITAEEAYAKNVIDLVAEDLPSLIKKLDGWEVMRKGYARTLHTDGVEQRTILPGWQHQVLRTISNPNIAYILLMIGLAGLYFELSQPGAILPGVIGGIALILALYALQTLPVAQTGAFLYLEPVITVIVAALILNERLYFATLTGGVMILAGVWLVNRKKSEKYDK